MTIEKPARSTLRRAILVAASTGFSGPLQGNVTLDAAPITFSQSAASNISSTNYWVDVSELIRTKINSAPAGNIIFTVGESNPLSLEGVVLTVVFDDPSQTADRSVTLLFGAMRTAGDTFTIDLSAPVDLSAPALIFQMSLGISYSYQENATQQYSTVDVNNTRLTSSAGGSDDGAPANGALITVGGVGDDPSNPSPNALPANARTDDELYDLKPFVHNGDRRILVSTHNPSADDNVFFAAFTMNPPATSINTDGGVAAVAGLGDSIAAGHGVGVSTWRPDDLSSVPPTNENAYPNILAKSLGERAVDYAISGACIGKRGDTVASGSPFPISAKTAEGCPDDNVNDEVRRLVASGQQPSVITLTVGGNDIRFGDCFRAALAISGFESSSNSDPCTGPTFANNLAGYKENLTSLISFLKTTFPRAEIVQTKQYLPLPVASPSPPCRLFYLGYVVSDPGGFATHLKNGTLDAAVVAYADRLGGRQVAVTTVLNNIISTVASKFGVATTESSAFSGHDLCGQYENYDPYVLAPRATVTLNFSYKSISFDKTLTLTTKDSYSNGTANGCSDDPCIDITNKVIWKGNGATVTVKSAHIEANGVPHPNVAGQTALASAVVNALF